MEDKDIILKLLELNRKIACELVINNKDREKGIELLQETYEAIKDCNYQKVELEAAKIKFSHTSFKENTQ